VCERAVQGTGKTKEIVSFDNSLKGRRVALSLSAKISYHHDPPPKKKKKNKKENKKGGPWLILYFNTILSSTPSSLNIFEHPCSPPPPGVFLTISVDYFLLLLEVVLAKICQNQGPALRRLQGENYLSYSQTSSRTGITSGDGPYTKAFNSYAPAPRNESRQEASPREGRGWTNRNRVERSGGEERHTGPR